MAFRRALLRDEVSSCSSGRVASTSRAAYFPASHQCQVFLGWGSPAHLPGPPAVRARSLGKQAEIYTFYVKSF